MENEKLIQGLIVSKPLIEGYTKGNRNPPPDVPRPNFTPSGQGLPPASSTAQPASQPGAAPSQGSRD